ncbi:MAG: ABC transporter substrate-binding protein [Chloroflexi bacterium]|nr:ABC transporter substrate-binding protein [Chloroflexota bacterium]
MRSSIGPHFWQRRLTRRQIIGGAARAGVGMAGLSILGCAAAPAATPVSSPAPTATPGPTYGGTLIGIMGFMPAFDPGFHLSGSFDEALYDMVYNSLLLDKVDGTLAPELAESWEIPDPTTFVFKLRRGVKFHDGTDFNAQVVKAHYERLADKEYAGPQAVELKKSFKSAQAVDEYTYKMTIKEPAASFLPQCTTTGGSGMISNPADAKKRNDVLKTGGIGTGPFMANEWLMDERASVKKFSGYWEKGIPYLDAVVWRMIPSFDVQLTMLRAGEAHLNLEVQTKDLPLLKNDPNIVVRIVPGTKRKNLVMNMLNSPFKNKAVRQALAYAIDRETVTKAIWGDLYQVGAGPFPPSTWAYDPNLKGYPFDLAKAKEKLVEGGYPNGFQGKILSGGAPDETQLAEVAQQQLAKIGIRLDVDVVEKAKWTSIRNTDDKTYDLFAASSGEASIPSYLIEEYYSPRAKVAMVKAKNPQLDSLLEKAKVIYEPEAQRPLVWDMAKLITEDVLGMYTVAYPVNIYAHRKEVHGTELAGNYTDIRLRKAWLAKA